MILKKKKKNVTDNNRSFIKCIFFNTSCVKTICVPDIKL